MTPSRLNMPPPSRVEKPLPPTPSYSHFRSSSLNAKRLQKGGTADACDSANLERSSTLPRRKQKQWVHPTSRPGSPLRFQVDLSPSSKSQLPACTTATGKTFRPGQFPRTPYTRDDQDHASEDHDELPALRTSENTAIRKVPGHTKGAEPRALLEVTHPYAKDALGMSNMPGPPYEIDQDSASYDQTRRTFYLAVDPEWDESQPEATLFLCDHDPTIPGVSSKGEYNRESVLSIGGALEVLKPKTQIRTRRDQI